MTTTNELLKPARAARGALALAGGETRAGALRRMAARLTERTAEILAANRRDLEAARGRAPEVMLDRLRLDEGRIAAMAEGMLAVAALPDPVGRVLETSERPNGLLLQKVTVPMGVIAIIYESRPNVTSDAAALAIKSGSACVLRGGKEAFGSNNAIVEALKEGLADAGLPAGAVALVQDTSRASANELMRASGLVDLLIPRGGAGLIRACVENACVPVIQTGTGICHIYVDKGADLSMALRILENAKTSRPSVCNAVECVLVHRGVAAEFWKRALPLLDEKGVELRADPEALEILGTRAVPAADSDWAAEYDAYLLAVKTAGGMDEAIDFINAHGTQHSEAIITKNYFKAQHFLDHVDAPAVYVNASTRFTAGGQFGLGGEMGISTQKMHARGPMGLEELTSCKYVIYGEGQVR